MTHLNIAYLQGKQNGGGNSKKVEIVSSDDSVSIEKTETASEVSFDISTNTSEHDITSVDKTVVVTGNPKQGHNLSAKTSILRKVFINDDAAVAQLGSDYRMPSVEEFKELIDNCSVEKLVNINSYGFYLRYTSNINGNSILFPLVTDGDGDAHVETLYPGFIGDLDGFDDDGFRVCSDEEWESWTAEQEGEYGNVGSYIRAYYWTSDVNYNRNAHDYEHTSPYYFTVGELHYIVETGRDIMYQTLGLSDYNENKYYRGLSIRPVSAKSLSDTVDMGLPSGTRWRKFNLGVSQDYGQETDAGDHFAWGETETKDWGEGSHVNYYVYNYKYYDEEQNRNSKYNYDSRGVTWDSLDNIDGEKLINGQIIVDDKVNVKKFIDVEGNEYEYQGDDEELRFYSDGTIAIEDEHTTETYWDGDQEKERKVRNIQLSVQTIGEKNLYIYNIDQFVRACLEIAENYGNAYNLYIMNTIYFTNLSYSSTTIHLRGERSDLDWQICNNESKTWDFRVLFRYSKIIGYGNRKDFQTLYRDNGVNNTVTLSFDTVYAENINFGGETSSLYESSVAFSRPLLASNGNGWWKFYDCLFLALGEAVNDNKFFNVGSVDNRTSYNNILYHCDMVFYNCRWNCAARKNDWKNTTAPISIDCQAAYGYMHTITFFNSTKQLTSDASETGILAVHFTGHTWNVQSDGSVKTTGNANNNSSRQLKSLLMSGLPTTAQTVEGAIAELYQMIRTLEQSINQ